MGYVADSKQNPLVEVHKRVCLAFLSDKSYFDFTRTFDSPASTCQYIKNVLEP